MEVGIKKKIIKRRKEEIPPHVLEMGLNMLFVEPNSVEEFLRSHRGTIIPLVGFDELNDKEYEGIFIDLTEVAYDSRLDNIGLAKQNNTSMVVFFKDLILDEYQIYMHRIYGADAIVFPLDSITSKFIEKTIFICESMGMLAIPFISKENDLVKISNWDLVRIVMVDDESSIQIKSDNVEVMKYKKGKGILI